MLCLVEFILIAPGFRNSKHLIGVALRLQTAMARPIHLWLAAGMLVKLRGNRIDHGEVEAEINVLPSTNEAVAM